jgi:hypothetical protein
MVFQLNQPVHAASIGAACAGSMQQGVHTESSIRRAEASCTARIARFPMRMLHSTSPDRCFTPLQPACQHRSYCKWMQHKQRGSDRACYHTVPNAPACSESHKSPVYNQSGAVVHHHDHSRCSHTRAVAATHTHQVQSGAVACTRALESGAVSHALQGHHLWSCQCHNRASRGLRPRGGTSKHIIIRQLQLYV